MIDKDLFPTEYQAIETLKQRSLFIQERINSRKAEKRRKIEEAKRLCETSNLTGSQKTS